VIELRRTRRTLAADQRVDRASTLRFDQRCEDERCRATGANADHHIVRPDASPPNGFLSCGSIVLRAFDGTRERCTTSRHQCANARSGDSKRRRKFDSIEHAQAATGARAHVKHAPPPQERLGQLLSEAGNGLLRPLHRQNGVAVLFLK
jgi:hypothetical protein